MALFLGCDLSYHQIRNSYRKRKISLSLYMSQGEGFNGNSIKITMNATKDEKSFASLDSKHGERYLFFRGWIWFNGPGISGESIIWSKNCIVNRVWYCRVKLYHIVWQSSNPTTAPSPSDTNPPAAAYVVHFPHAFKWVILAKSPISSMIAGKRVTCEVIYMFYDRR